MCQEYWVHEELKKGRRGRGKSRDGFGKIAFRADCDG